MSAANELLALADKLERYSQSPNYDIARHDRQMLNEAVAAAKGMPLTVKVGHPALGDERMVPSRLPDFVGSIDAAATLVPEGCQWRVDTHHNMAGVFEYYTDNEVGASVREYCGEGFSLPLALCAAALRAKAGAA